MSKLVVVLGATGGQGNSVISTLLTNPVYRIRGLTRDPSSSKAQALSAKGVEMVSVDIDSEDSLIQAFKGANYIFAMTDFFAELFTNTNEAAQAIEYSRGVNMAKAASRTPTLEHYIWSTLHDTRALTKGTVSVPHADGKADVDAFIKQDPALLAKTTFLWPTIFTETFTSPMLVPNLLKSAGKHVWLLPVSPATSIFMLGDHRVNLGPFVAAIFAKPHLSLKSKGQYVLAYVEKYTLAALAEQWSAVTSKALTCVQITMEDYERLWPKFGTEVGLNLKVFELCPGEKSWEIEGQEWIGKDELGIGESELSGIEESLKAIDWDGAGV